MIAAPSSRVIGPIGIERSARTARTTVAAAVGGQPSERGGARARFVDPRRS